MKKMIRHFNMPSIYLIPSADEIENAPAGNQTRVWSVAGTYTITVLLARLMEHPGFDPGASCLRSTRASDCANAPKFCDFSVLVSIFCCFLLLSGKNLT